MHSNRAVEFLRQLLREVLQLDRKHIDNVEGPLAFRDSLAKPRGQLAVDAGHLQCASRQRPLKFRERGVEQFGIVSPENEVRQPRALKKPYGVRMNIRPPIMSVQILRHLNFTGSRFGRRHLGDERFCLVAGIGEETRLHG